MPKLKLQVRMWSRRLSLVTVATEILRFLSMTVVTTQSFDHSFFDKRIPIAMEVAPPHELFTLLTLLTQLTELEMLI